MHYVVGWEPIDLEQMKDIYYVPHLLQKIIDGEPLPRVELFSGKDLFSLAVYEPPKPDQKSFAVKLVNRGGGIGQAQVLVNGKEFIRDARPNGFDPRQPSATLRISLEGAPLVAGRENKVEVVAHNSAGSLSSRGSMRGAEIVQVFDYGTRAEPPNIYAIVGGISAYTGDGLNLSFAAKDAEDFARAFEAGAARLFGADKVHIRLLSSDGDKANVKFTVADAKTYTATKADFARAFSDFQTATPNDIFVVYLAGHGVALNLNQNQNQPGGGTYLYLTQEATTTDRSVLSLEEPRRAMALSSDELAELMKRNRALKQVLVLDTCAAGAAAASLAARRDSSSEELSDQIRAIERLKDRTGFFALMGAAADKVSYEASQYGQGLLTYALLEGVRGARLREGEYADVGALFGYAQDTVPELAKNVGGIQRPLVIAPDAGGSFDIGRFTLSEQSRIPLALVKPLVLRPRLINPEQGFDELELEAPLRKIMREMSYAAARGQGGQATAAGFVFVDADEMTGALRPSGTYTVSGDAVTITLNLICDGKKLTSFQVAGDKRDTAGLLKKVAAEMSAAASKIP